MKDPKLELAEYRLQRAFETMEEAVALIRENDMCIPTACLQVDALVYYTTKKESTNRCL